MKMPGLVKHSALFDLGPTHIIQGEKHSQLYYILDFVSLQLSDSGIGIRYPELLYVNPYRVMLLEARLEVVGV